MGVSGSGGHGGDYDAKRGAGAASLCTVAARVALYRQGTCGESYVTAAESATPCFCPLPVSQCPHDASRQYSCTVLERTAIKSEAICISEKKKKTEFFFFYKKKKKKKKKK